jgi:hypothetical protein
MTPAGSPRLYDREASRPRQRDLACQHCALDRDIEGRRAAATARGPISSESPYAHKQQIPTPLPPSHGHTMIPFQPTPSAYSGRAFGVSMRDILDFRPCLKDPDTPVLDNGVDQVFLTLEVHTCILCYLTMVSRIYFLHIRRRAMLPSSSQSRETVSTGRSRALISLMPWPLRLTHFSKYVILADISDGSIISHKDFPFNPAGLKAAAIVVRSVAELRLVNLYSRDGRVWRVHVAYCV